MKLSDGEKLIIAMLADVMKATKAQSDLDPDFIVSAIHGGHLWAIRDEYPGLLHSEDDEDDEVKETMDILDMFRLIEGSIAKLQPNEVAALGLVDGRAYYGFDGNHDAHYGIARFLIEKQNKWQEFANYEFNSHMTVLPGYRRMLAVFNEIDWTRNLALTFDEIKAVLDARNRA